MSREAARRALEKPVREVVFSAPIDIGGTDKVFVVPGTIHLGGTVPAKTIRWTNNTGDEVQIWLAAAQDILVPPAGVDLSEPVDIPNGGDLVVSVVDGVVEFSGDYHVFCDVINNFADGNSPPQMSCP